MRQWVLLLALIASLWTAPAVIAQEPSARAWADSSSFLIGDPITVHVEITHQSPLAFTPLVEDTLGGFHVLDRVPARSSSPMMTTARFTFAAYDSGTAILPPLQFLYTRSSDSSRHVVATNPLIFTIHLVEVDTAKDIKDIKPPISIPLTIAEISLILGTVVGLALLVYSFMQYRRRRKEHGPVDKYIPPPKPAHILAFEELATLKEKRMWQQGLVKPYYTEVTEIIRRYFENRFGFLSLEKTTDETLHDLHRFAIANQIMPQTETLLRRADLVKFAKYQPAIAENEEMLALAFEIVDRTKVIERPAPSDGEKSEQREADEVVHV